MSKYLISTHAPAGGATRRKKAMGSVCKNFYSRPCGRGDGRFYSAFVAPSIFLLTPLREGRRETLSC